MTQSQIQGILPTGALTMSSREIAELCEKRHDNVMRICRELKQSGVTPQIEEFPFKHKGNQYIEYHLSKRDSLVLVARLSPEFTAIVVDRWIELEELTKAPVFKLPDFNNPIIAARAWADEREARQIAETKKAEIGSRREATAMNTASTQAKRANKLKGELDLSKQYASVKRMEATFEGQKFNWHPLKKTSQSLGIPVVKVFDANYGHVNTYHCDVWQEVYGLVVPDTEVAA